MKRTSALAAGLLTAVFFIGIAWVKNTQDEVNTGSQTFEGPVDIRGTFLLDGEPITATASDINHLGTGVSLTEFTNLTATAVRTTDAAYTATVAKATSAVQPTDSAYTNTAAKAASALQPGAVGSGPTNAVSHGLTVTINGTNYVVQLYPVND